jgi:hypothetical protein
MTPELRLCNNHGGATVAKPGTVFMCPLCNKEWVYGERNQKPIKHDTRGIV